MFWLKKKSFGELQNSFSMQLAVIKNVINLIVLASISRYMYHFPRYGKEVKLTKVVSRRLMEDIT